MTPQPARPVFREGQRLTAEALTAEQVSRAWRLARHQRGVHGPGVLTGLEVTLSGSRIEVSPGAALLPDGAVLTLRNRARAEVPAEATTATISLRARDTISARHAQRCAVLSVTPGLPSLDADGVVLATLESGAAPPVSAQYRQTGSTRADRIDAASGDAVLSIGPDARTGETRLSVGFGAATPILTIDRRLGARLDGSLTVMPAREDERPAIALPGIHFPEASAPPEGAAPWSLRRVRIEEEDSRREELRLELHHPGKQGDPARSRLSLRGPDGGMTLDAVGMLSLLDGQDRAEQGIAVRAPGRIAYGPLSPQPSDPAFAALLTDRMFRGLSWALIIAMLRTGITGRVQIDGVDIAGVQVALNEDRQTTTDAAGRFFFATAGWPGQSLALVFQRDGTLLGERGAVVGAPLQVFAFAGGGG
ncbi:MAG: hypothetical protein AAF675_13070 [Pseudomonadota bacterium]